MKESKFIELLNLYIDHQISSEEATLLEHEILQDPSRRKIYNQYCRMHRACTMALDRSLARSEAMAAAGQVVAFETGSRSRWGYYVAGLATAACVTIVAVHTALRPDGSSPARSVATAPQVPALASSTAAAAITPVRLDVPRRDSLPMTERAVAQKLSLPVASDASFLASSSPDNDLFSLPMLPTTTLRPTARPTIEDFVFTDDPANPAGSKIFRAHQPGDKPEESNAIEFQR